MARGTLVKGARTVEGVGGLRNCGRTEEGNDFMTRNKMEIRNIGKRLVGFVLLVVMILEGVPGLSTLIKSNAAVYGWDGHTKTEVYPLDEVYWISSPDELAWFASEVNGGNDFYGKTVYITDYIDLNNKPWTPISGQISGNVIFADCTIQRLNCVQSMGGLFGKVVVRNLTLRNTVIEDAEIKGCSDDSIKQQKGILASHLTVDSKGKVDMEMIDISGTIDRQTGWAWGDIGGVFGVLVMSDESTIKINNAYIDTNISVSGGISAANVGGVSAYVEDPNHEGSILLSKIEINDNLTVRNSYGYNGANVGGIFGCTNGGNYYIDQCNIMGEICSSAYAGWAGGMISQATYKTLQISDSMMSASVSANFNGWYGASHNGGGLLGYSNSKDDENSFIKNSMVTGHLGSGCAFVAHAESAKDICVTNSLFDTNTTGLSQYDMYGVGTHGDTSNNNVHDSKGYETSILKKANLYGGWDSEDVWKIEVDNYPDLYWKQREQRAYGARDIENKDIIERVAEYASDSFFAQYDQIMQMSCSDDKKYQLLADLCINQGFADPKEGIKYLTNTSNKRMSYAYLTNDDLYMAHQLRDFLVNGGEKGSALRALLVVDGLVFNEELGEWKKPTTYISGEYPWVKKYKNMLYSFMEQGTELNIVKNETAKTWLKIAQKVSDTEKKLYIDPLLDEINDAKSVKEINIIMHKAETRNALFAVASERNDGSHLLKFKLSEEDGFGMLNKVVSDLNDIYAVTDLTTDFFQDMVMLNSQIAVYEQYHLFLEEICNSEELDENLKTAAKQILNEIQTGAYSKVKSFCIGLLGQVDKQGKITSSVWEEWLEKMNATSIDDFFKQIELAAFWSNQVVDMSKVVKYEAYVEGYAQLGEWYSKKLELAKRTFQSDRSEQNAWEFYRLYNLLYRLRVAGEESYIDMLSLESRNPLIGSYGINPKVESVKKVVATIKRYHQFTMQQAQNVPLSCQFAVKTVIKCPVDVKIYTPDQELIASLSDGVLSDDENEYGRFAVIQDYCTGDYTKIICFYQKQDYVLKITANDDSFVSVYTTTINDDNMYVLNNQQIQKGNMLNTTVDQILINHTMRMNFKDESEQGEEIGLSLVKKEKICKDLSLDKDTLDLKVGESYIIRPQFVPVDTTDQQVCWLSSNDDIVKVVDGKVSAMAPGTAKIQCVSLANSSLVGVCTIRVAKVQKPSDNAGVTEVTPSNSSHSENEDAEKKENSAESDASDSNDSTLNRDDQSSAADIKWKFLVNGRQLELMDVKEKSPKTYFLRNNLKINLKVTGAEKIYYKIVKKGENTKNVKYQLFRNPLIIKKSDITQCVYFKVISKDRLVTKKKTRNFMIDRTPPTVRGVKDGQMYRSKVRLSFADESGISSAKLNGKSIESGITIKKSGEYRLVVVDKMGNKKKVEFSVWR